MMVRALARIPNRNMARLALREPHGGRGPDGAGPGPQLERCAGHHAGRDPVRPEHQQLSFLGVPIRIVDQLGDAESLVS